MLSECETPNNNLTCLILIHLDEQMHFQNQIIPVSIEFISGVQILGGKKGLVDFSLN